MKDKIYTYDVKNISETSIAVIRYINDNDTEENYFENLEALENQLVSEGFSIEYSF